MKSITQLIKQLLCIHDWECISDVWTCTAETVRYRCRRCGKEEGL